MKKMTLILGAMLVSLSVLAVPVEKANFAKKFNANFASSLDAKMQMAPKANAVQKVSTTVDFATISAFKAANSEAIAAFRAPQLQAANLSTIAAKETGVGTASIEITAGEGTDNLYYMLGILSADGQTMYAYMMYYKLATFVANIASTYDLLYGAYTTSSQGGYINTDVLTSFSLPKGKYVVALMGYPLNAAGDAVDTSEAADLAMAQFELTMDGTEYAVTNAKVTLSENNQFTITWSNAAKELPEGSTYEVFIYSLPDNQKIADSGAINATTWTTPADVTISNNSSYEIYIAVWSPDGYELGNAADVFYCVGTDPNAPTNLNVTVDDETMKATFTWKNTLPSSYTYATGKSATVYNQVLILDENGKVYQFDNGYNNTLAETGTSEQLPVGKYTWQVIPFYATTSWYFIAVVDGPAFEVKDRIAPVINSVSIASTSDTEVYLNIDVQDNALNVTPADLVYAVTGDLELADAKLEADGTLKLSGLTAKSYKIQITATDPSGNKSEAFAYEFTPVKDDEAPKNLKAEIAEGNIYDKYVIINVSAEDNIASAEQLTYILTFADGTAVELQAKNGQVVLEGLTPETAYEVVVTVKDFGGNTAAETVALKFTTVELIPIELDVDFAQLAYDSRYSQEGAQNFQLILARINEAGTALTLPEVFLDLYMPTTSSFAGIYSKANGNLEEKYSGFMLEGDKKDRSLTNAELELKYIYSEEEDGEVYYLYYIYLEFMDEAKENLYYIEGNFWVHIWLDEDTKGTTTDKFQDTDAPQLWLHEDYVEAYGTSAELLFGAYDGPYIRYQYCVDEECTQIERIYDEIYTKFTELTLEVQAEDGTVLASVAAGSIENTPTLDEDGDLYFTATLNNLEPNTDYVVYIYAKDNAGNESDRLQVSFNSGRPDAINQVVSDVTVKKVIRNGQLIIKRGEKVYNALGAELK